MLTTIASILVPQIPALIQLVERLFVKSKTGTEKMDTVVQWLRVIITKLGAVNVIDPKAGQPTDDQLGALVEGVFQSMKSNGTLTAPGVDLSQGKLWLLQGNVVPVSLPADVTTQNKTPVTA